MDHVNRDALKKDMDDLKAELLRVQKKNAEQEFAHLQMIIGVTNAFTLVGMATLGLPFYYVVPWICLSTGVFARWTMVAHHTCHGGYDTTGKKRYNRRRFALGGLYRRCSDWLDWMLPEAWNLEHNNLHHYRLGEIADPDLVEENLTYLRKMNQPFWFKRLLVFGMAATWKWFYYAPNTFKHLCLHRLRSEDAKTFQQIPQKVKDDPVFLSTYLVDYRAWMDGLLSIVMAPYFLFNFVILPLLWMGVGVSLWDRTTGYQFFWNALTNMIIMEIFTNLHSFLMIVTNHAGNDLYRFETECAPLSGEFYLRQILSSANFDAGDDMTDYVHGWLNYQVEHHLFPSLSMLSYRRAMPLVKKICIKHRIPYCQENVWIRLMKTVDIMIGKTSMKRLK